MKLNKEQIDAIVINTLQIAVSEVTHNDPHNENMTDGECLDVLLESVEKVLKFLTNTKNIKQTKNGS